MQIYPGSSPVHHESEYNGLYALKGKTMVIYWNFSDRFWIMFKLWRLCLKVIYLLLVPALQGNNLTIRPSFLCVGGVCWWWFIFCGNLGFWGGWVCFRMIFSSFIFIKFCLLFLVEGFMRKRGLFILIFSA